MVGVLGLVAAAAVVAVVRCGREMRLGRWWWWWLWMRLCW